MIEIGFENCDTVTVLNEDLTFLRAAGITEFINVNCGSTFREKEAKFLRLVVRNKPAYSRILERNDIADVIVAGQRVRIAYEMVDGGNNANQRTTATANEITVVVAPRREVD